MDPKILHVAGVTSILQYGPDDPALVDPRGPTQSPGTTLGSPQRSLERTLREQAPPLAAFELQKLLSFGGFGQVWRAREVELGRLVALKIGKKEGVEELRREARVLAHCEGEFVPRLYGSLQQAPGGEPFLPMEYLSGGNLRYLMDQGRRLSWPELDFFSRKIVGAVAWVHEKGVVHRDIKPENFVFTGGDRTALKIIDFGLANLLPPSGALPSEGRVTGSIGYMSPEVVVGGDITLGADVFALGATLYELATGQKPYEIGSGDVGDLWLAYIQAVTHEHPVSPREIPGSLVPEEYSRIIMKALAPLGERYKDASAMLQDLTLCKIRVLEREVESVTGNDRIEKLLDLALAYRELQVVSSGWDAFEGVLENIRRRVVTTLLDDAPSGTVETPNAMPLAVLRSILHDDIAAMDVEALQIFIQHHLPSLIRVLDGTQLEVLQRFLREKKPPSWNQWRAIRSKILLYYFGETLRGRLDADHYEAALQLVVGSLGASADSSGGRTLPGDLVSSRETATLLRLDLRPGRDVTPHPAWNPLIERAEDSVIAGGGHLYGGVDLGVSALFHGEGHASRAVLAGLSMMRELTAPVRGLLGGEAAPSVLIHSGPVELMEVGGRRRATLPSGEVRAGLDQMVWQVSGPGIFVGKSTRELLEGRFLSREVSGAASVIHEITGVQRGAGVVTSFVGREEELRLVADVFTSQSTSSVIVSGPAGMGKTAFGLQVLDNISTLSPYIFRVQGSEYGSRGILETVARAVVDSLKLDTEAPEDQVKSSLRRILEDRLEKRPVRLDAAEVDLHTENLFRLFDRSPLRSVLTPEAWQASRDSLYFLVSLLSDYGLDGARPVVVFLDNLHWLDPAVVKFFSDMAAVVTGSPGHLFCILAMGRESDRYHENVRRFEAATTPLKISLRFLSTDKLLEIGQQILETPPTAAEMSDLRELISLSGGNTFLYQEMVRAKRQGVFAKTAERWKIRRAGGSLESVDITPGTDDFLQARISHLELESRFLLNIVSLLADFSVSDVVELAGVLRPDMVSGWTEPKVGRMILDLVDQDILHPSPTEGRWQFSHGLMQEAAYKKIREQDRPPYHAAAAAVMEKTSPHRHAEIAYHFEAGGYPEDAAKKYYLAAEDEKFIDPEKAEKHYRDSWRLSSTQEGQVHASRGLFELLFVNKRHEEAIQVCDELGKIAHSLSLVDQAGISFRKARALLRSGQTDTARSLLEGVLETLQPESTPDAIKMRISVLAELSFFSAESGALTQAETYARESLAIAEVSGDKGLEARAQWVLCHALGRRGVWLPEMAQWYASMIRVFLDKQEYQRAVSAAMSLIWIAAVGGKTAEALRFLRGIESWEKKYKFRIAGEARADYLFVRGGVLTLSSGRAGEALPLLEEALAQFPGHFRAADGRVVLALAYLQTNQASKALGMMRASYREAMERHRPIYEAASYMILARVLLQREQPDNARTAITRARTTLAPLQSTTHWEWMIRETEQALLA